MHREKLFTVIEAYGQPRGLDDTIVPKLSDPAIPC